MALIIQTFVEMLASCVYVVLAFEAALIVLAVAATILIIAGITK